MSDAQYMTVLPRTAATQITQFWLPITESASLCLVHTTDKNKTKLSRLVLSVSAVWTKLETSQVCRQHKISRLFCPVSNSVHIAEKTRQERFCSVFSCQYPQCELDISVTLTFGFRL